VRFNHKNSTKITRISTVAYSQPVVTDLGILQQWMDHCYAVDTEGRITDSRGVLNAGALPRFVIGYAREGVIWRFRTDLAPELVRDLARLAARELSITAGERRPGGVVLAHRGDLPTRPERLASMLRLLSREDEGQADATHERVEIAGRSVGEVWSVA
jgi:hypothetical protein